jgi:hypothetical protein
LKKKMERPFKITKLDTLFQHYATPEEYAVFANLTATLADPERIEQFKRRVLLSAFEKLATISNGGLLAKILFKLPLEDVRAMCQVSTTVRNVCKKYQLIERFYHNTMYIMSDDNDDFDLPKTIRLNYRVKMISGLNDFVAFITYDGKGYSFGNNGTGSLGAGIEESEDIIPMPQPILSPEPIIHISCGMSHMGFVTASGKVYTCGYGEFGRLGDGNGDDHNYNTPTLASSLCVEPVKQISCGNSCTTIITQSEKIFFVGLLLFDEEEAHDFLHIDPLQITTADPSDVFVKISLGLNHLGILTSSHKLYMFGKGRSGRLGDGVITDHFISDANLSYFIPNVTDVICFDDATMFVDLIGNVYRCDAKNERPSKFPCRNVEKILGGLYGHEIAFITKDGNVYDCFKRQGLNYETIITIVKKVEFNGNTPISCGIVTSSFNVFIINEIDGMLPINAPCLTCGNVDASFYTSDYSGVYCGKKCYH